MERKIKKISVKLPDAALHSQPQPARKVSRRKHFQIFSPTRNMNKFIDLKMPNQREHQREEVVEEADTKSRTKC